MADFISSLNGVQMDNALLDMAEHTSEAYAVGERNGVPVDSSDVTYHNNARYYAQQAQSIAPASVTEAVRWDVAQTALTDAQREQARENINAADNDTSVQVVRQTFNSAQQEIARANIAAANTNPNLLDNPFFSVNQRSWATGSTNGYTVDRWRQYNCTTTVNADGSLNIASTSGGTFYENCPYDAFLIGKPVTLSVLYQNGTIAYGAITVPSSGTTYTSTFTDGTKLGLTITGTSTIGFSMALPANANVNVRAFKWELGSVNTLANDTPPDYGTELAKCQRYFVRIKQSSNYTYFPAGFGANIASSATRVTINTPVPLKETGTVTVTYSGSVYLVGNGAIYTVSGMSLYSVSPTGVLVGVTTTTAPTDLHTYTLSLAAVAYIDLSSDL